MHVAIRPFYKARAPVRLTQDIDIEYNKRLDHRRPCLEDDLTAGSNL